MGEIKYEIVIESKGARPYVKLPDDFKQEPETKYVIMDLSLSVLIEYINLINSLPEEKKPTDEYYNKLVDTIKFMGGIADELAMMISDQKSGMDEINDILGNIDKKEDEED